MNLFHTRRQFLRNSGVALAALSLAPEAFTQSVFNADDEARVKHLGLQLWSVRDEMKKDARVTLKALAKMGYKEVEGFGYSEGRLFKFTPHDFKLMLNDLGLKMYSSHIGMTLNDYDASTDSVSDNIKKAFNDAARIGQKYVICPWMAEPERKEIRRMVQLYGAAAKYAKSVGLRFAYHNHDFEYTMKGPDDRLLIEWLLKEVDPENFAMQMDVYWVYFANQKPLDWFKKYPGRWELTHLKDMARSEKRETIEIGDGVVNFAEILQNAKLAGLKYYVIELEDYKTTPMKGVERSLAGFKNIR